LKKISNKVLLSIFLVLIIGAYTIAGYFLISPEPLIIQGEVEASQVRVATKIPGRINRLYIKEGEKIKKGQILAQIKSPEINAKLNQAEAAKKAAYAQKNKADNGARFEKIIGAKSIWLKAKAGENLAKKTYGRMKSLYQAGVIPAQKMDQAKAQYIAAKSTSNAAKAAYDMAVNGARQEDKIIASELLNRAEGKVAEVKAYLKETKITAPINGEITSIIPKVGELVTPGFPIINIVDLNDVWVTFNIREDILSEIKMGSIINAKFPALNNREIKLKINYIKALGQYATWQATKASGDFDLKTFEIRAIPLKKVKGLYPGMSAIIAWSSKSKLKSF